MARAKYPRVNHWGESILTSAFAALASTAILAGTTRDTWTLSVAFVGTFAAGVVQHRRQIQRKQWTPEVRNEKRRELKRDAASEGVTETQPGKDKDS